MDIFNGETARWLGVIARQSWQGAALIALIWLLCRAVPQIPASMRCRLWWLACAKMLVGLVWVSPLALPILPAIPRQAALAVHPAALSQNVIQPTVPSAPAMAHGAVPADTADLADMPAPAVSPAPAPLTPLSVLALLWLIGAAALLASSIRQAAAAGRLRRQASPVGRAETCAALADVAARLGLRRLPCLLETPAVKTPLVIGPICPALALPAGFAATLTPGELRMALAHELAHVRRGDLWQGLIPVATRMLFWFHPLVWLACREYAAAREESCDATALLATGAPAARYGQLLLKMMARAGQGDSGAALGISPSFATMKRRLQQLRPASKLSPAIRALLGGATALGLALMTPWTLTAAVGSLPAPPTPAAALQPSYIVTDIGSDHGRATYATAVNENGQVVGGAHATRHGELGQAFLWQNGVLHPLGALPGYRFSLASGINNSGQVIASSFNYVRYHHAFLWQGDKKLMGGLRGSPYTKALDINDAGQVVGFAQTGARYHFGAQSARAFLWDGRQMRDLGTLGGPHSYASGINNSGQVVGKADLPPRGRAGYQTHAFLWQEGVMIDLGTLPGGANSAAARINSIGQVVGFSETGETRHAFLWEDDQMRDLGTLPGSLASEADGINNNGQVVGACRDDTAGKITRAFLWQAGRLMDLNSLIPADSGWSLDDARAINDQGQIVGRGHYRGQERAFLLTPMRAL